MVFLVFMMNKLKKGKHIKFKLIRPKTTLFVASQDDKIAALLLVLLAACFVRVDKPSFYRLLFWLSGAA